MALERELKLTLYGDAPDFSKIAELGGYAIRALGLEKQVNTYYDTPEFALARSRWALRLRALEGACIVTLKGPESIANGLHTREELETQLRVGQGLEDIDDPDILRGIAQFTDLERLKRIVRLETRRHRFEVMGVGELTLDQVSVLDERDRVTLRFEEIELELDRDVSDSVLEKLEQAIQVIAPVGRSTTNKLQRALEAIGHEGRLRATTPWALAASRVIGHELERFRAFLPMAVAGLDPEGVHGSRVSIRRLRAALKVFSDALPARTGSLNDELRWLGARLGAVRDLDVMIEGLPERSLAAGQDPGNLKAAVRILERERSRARAAMLRALNSSRFVRLERRLERLTERLSARSRTTRAELATTNLEGDSAIRRVYTHLRRDARLALDEDAPLEAIHTLRKSTKRVRYALEFLEPAIGEAASQAIAHLKLVQERLGQINDASVSLEKLCSIAKSLRDARAGFALGVIVGRLENELTDARRAFERAWEKYDPKAEAKVIRNALEHD